MENQFSFYTKEQAVYSFYPCIQFYCPKSYQTFSIGQNLEETTLHVPQTPQAISVTAPQRPQMPTAPLMVDSILEEEKQTLVKHRKGIKENRRNSGEQYKPYERQGRKRANCLKENRNVLPIKIRQMLSFLTREKKSQEIIHRYIEKNGFNRNFSEKRFYAFLKMKKEKVGNYVTLSILKNFLGVQPQKSELYPINEQTFYLRIVRVMFKYYLDNISCLCSLTSNRIQSDQKREHVRVQRQLVNYLQKDPEC